MINQFDIILDIINNNKLSHSLLFEVDYNDNYMDKILNIIKLMYCNKKNKNYDSLNCGNCNICRLIDENSFPDLSIVDTDSSWIKKQQLLDLKSEFNNKSLSGFKKIYIIKEAEKLNASSSNSLLKFLEEPEDDIIAILVTSNRYLLLDTIISRCQVFNLKGDNNFLNDDEMSAVLCFLEYIKKKNNLFIDYKRLLENIFIDKNNAINLLNNVEKYIVSNNFKCDIELKALMNFVSIIEVEKQKLEYNLNFKLWLDSFFSRIIGEVYV